jgi:hypothetical protein
MSTRLHKQERQNTCAVAALRTALDVQLGVKISESVLEAHGTDANEPILKFGSSATHLRRMLAGVNRTHNKKKRAWRFKIKANGDLRDLKRELVAGRAPVVRVYEPNDVADYHMIVVLAVTDERVKVFDPADDTSTSRWMSAVEFVAWWHGDERSSWYAVVNSD